MPAASGAGASAPALPEGFLHRLDWQAVPAVPGGRSGGELLLLGHDRFAARVTPGLERAGWRVIRPSGIDDWRRQREQRPDAETVYLVSEAPAAGLDRKSVVYGKRVSVRVDLRGRRIIKKKKK